MLDVKTIHFCEVYNNQSLNIRHQTGFERLLKTQFSVTEMKGSVMLGSLLVAFSPSTSQTLKTLHKNSRTSSKRTNQYYQVDGQMSLFKCCICSCEQQKLNQMFSVI